jgi:hypothetical protein
MLVPLILIICFGGGMVAVNKPFNSKAVFLLATLAISIAIFGFAAGVTKIVGAIGLVLSLFGIYSLRSKR